MDTFYTPKHKRLDTIAMLANVAAWLVLVYWLLIAIGRTIRFVELIGPSILTTVAGNPWEVVNGLASILYALFTGIVTWLVLRGVTLGLNMIIETDLNYRMNAGGSHDG